MVGGCKLTESDPKWPENVIFFVGLSGFFYYEGHPIKNETFSIAQ